MCRGEKHESILWVKRKRGDKVNSQKVWILLDITNLCRNPMTKYTAVNLDFLQAFCFRFRKENMFGCKTYHYNFAVSLDKIVHCSRIILVPGDSLCFKSNHL